VTEKICIINIPVTKSCGGKAKNLKKKDAEEWIKEEEEEEDADIKRYRKCTVI
jgi:hypothetical protein